MPRIRFLLVAGFIACGLLALSAFLLPAAHPIHAAPSSPRDVVVLHAVKSTYTDQGSPDTNFGGLPELHAGLYEKTLFRRFIYLQFDLSKVPPGADFASAKLRLYQESATGADPYWIWSWTVPAPWSESTINWANQPWPGLPSGPQAGLSPVAGWQEWDVTSIVDPWFLGAPAHGIVLAGDNITFADHVFASRLGKAPPELVIEYSTGATETPTSTSSVTLTPSSTSTPTRTATATNTPTPTPTIPPAAPDIRIVGMEITQGLQNLNNQMPLVAQRETRVRAYIFSMSGYALDVRARLRAYGTNGAELPGSPVWSEWTVSTHGGSIVRTNVRDGFFFYVPVNWRTGLVRFRLEVNPDNAIAESNYANNTYEETVRFHPLVKEIAVVRRAFNGYYLNGGVTYNVNDPLVHRDTLQSLKRYYPIVGLPTYFVADPMDPLFYCSFTGDTDLENAGCMLARVSYWSSDNSDHYYQEHYVGMVDPADDTGSVGGLGEVGGWASWVRISRGANPAWYRESSGTLAHELGHNHGLNHVNCAGRESWGGEHPEWVEPGYPWPYPNCRLAAVDVWGYYGLDIQHAVAGVPGPTVLTNDPAGPEYNRAWPIMGYRRPYWISPWELCRFMPTFGIPCSLSFSSSLIPDAAAVQQQVLADPAAFAPKAQVAALMAATDYIRVHGRVWRDGKYAELWHVQQMTDPVEKALQVEVEQLGKLASLGVPAGVPELTLNQLDASGKLLSSTPVYVPEVTEPLPWLTFIKLVPRAPGAVRVQLQSGALPLAERAATGSSPVVKLLEPNTGMVGKGSNVQWSASDADGDKLFFDVLYSADDGTTWQVLAQDVDGSSAEVKIDLIGSKMGRMRVRASDGFWTASDQSDDYLTSENNAPQPVIGGPQDGDTFPTGSLVVLTGEASDLEDGTIAGASLSWRSSHQGELGAGVELPLWHLQPGPHTITLTATDSEGKAAEVSISIFIGHKVYLPALTR